MDISYNWLQDYIEEELPDPSVVAKTLTRGAYEIESVKSVEDNTVFDIDVLPNRASDSLGHLGVARELAVLMNLSFNSLRPDPETTSSYSSSDSINLLVGTDKCRRALKRLAVEVEVGESPDWLKRRLETLGQKSINNIVDITNFLMLETGQPVHAFDYDKLAGEEKKDITIRPAKNGEKVTTLDGDTYELDEGMLVIADDEKPLDIAGIKGGQASGIDKNTTRVMLSVCSFAPTTIRKTSQKLNLRTDASKRFENNVPPAMSRLALERFSELMVSVAGASVAEDVCDVYPNPAGQYKVGVTSSRINDLLGVEISESEAADILEKIGCKVDMVTPRENVIASAPEHEGVPYSYGASVTRDAPDLFDCSSFTSWLYVQGGIALPRMTADQFVYTEEITEDELKPGDLVFSNTEKDEGGEIYYKSQEYMPGTEIPDGVDHCGIYLGDGKVIHVSRHNHGEDGGVEVEDLAAAKQFQNVTKFGRVPESDEAHIVATIPDWRPDLRRSQDLIEEVARVYGYDNISGVLPTASTSQEGEISPLRALRNFFAQQGYSEVKTYSLVDQGDIKIKNPVAEDKAYLRKTLRVNLESVLEANEKHLPVLEAEYIRAFEIGHVFSKDEEVLQVGVASGSDNAEAEITDIFSKLNELINIDITAKIESGVGVANLSAVDDIEVKKTIDYITDFPAVEFQKPSAYPFVLRDVAVWTPSEMTRREVEDIIQSASDDLLVACNHFDTYEKEDKTSYAFKLVFQSPERTLSDDEVNEQMDEITDTLNNQEGFSVR